MVWEIDFSLQETNSSWQPHSAKWDEVLSLAPGEGTAWPPFSTWSATDRLLRGEWEILLEWKQRELYTPTLWVHRQGTAELLKAMLAQPSEGKLQRADLESETMSVPLSVLEKPHLSWKSPSTQTPPGKSMKEFLGNAAALFMALLKFQNGS